MKNTIQFLLKEVGELKRIVTDHLIESGGIKAQLRFNTWLTGLILAALLANFISTWFKHGG